MKKVSAYSLTYRRSTAFILVLICLMVVYRIFFVQRVDSKPREIVWFDSADTLADTKSRPKVPKKALSVNIISSEELQELGLEKVVADRWIKYRYSLGSFSTEEDLETLYGLPELWIEKFALDFMDGTNSTTTESKPQIVGATKDTFSKKQVLFANKINSEELQELGLNKSLADRFIKYRFSRRHFSSVEDLRSIYGISESWLAQFIWNFVIEEAGHSELELSPNLPQRNDEDDLTDTLKHSPRDDSPIQNNSKRALAKGIVVDINKSNEYQWQLLPGIGPYYARRITNFRDKLGGFHSIAQVAETYGLPDSVFQSIVPQLRESEISKKVLINFCTTKELASHPYIRSKDASILVNYRTNHGMYESISELYEVRAFDTSFIKRLEPYIEFSLTVEKAPANDGQDDQ